MASRLNVGVMGLGDMGRVYAQDLAQRVPNARLVAVADQKAGAGANSSPRNSAFPSGTRATRNCSTIRTWRPWPWSLPPARIKRSGDGRRRATGKPVFCEKPMAMSLPQDAQEMLRAGREPRARFFRWAFSGASMPGMWRPRRRWSEGVIGTPVVLTSTSRDPFRPPLEFCDPKVSGGLDRRHGHPRFRRGAHVHGRRQDRARHRRHAGVSRDEDPSAISTTPSSTWSSRAARWAPCT